MPTDKDFQSAVNDLRAQTARSERQQMWARVLFVLVAGGLTGMVLVWALIKILT
jgi:hypothetical protein